MSYKNKIEYQKIICLTILTNFVLAFNFGRKFDLNYPVNVTLNITAHIQKYGDINGHDSQWIGTKGESLRLEGFSIKIAAKVLPDLHMQYMAHIQDIGDTSYQAEGTYIGTKDEGKKLEGFAIRLIGQHSQFYDITYQAHLEGKGDTGKYKNGQFCGTRGESRRVEAIYISLTRKQFK